MKKRFRVRTAPVLAALLIALPLVVWLVGMRLTEEYATRLYAQIFAADMQKQLDTLTPADAAGNLAERYDHAPEAVEYILLEKFEHYYRASYKGTRRFDNGFDLPMVEEAEYQAALAVFSDDGELLLGGGRRHVFFTYSDSLSKAGGYPDTPGEGYMDVDALGLSGEEAEVLEEWINGDMSVRFLLTGRFAGKKFIPQKIEYSENNNRPVWSTLYEAAESVGETVTVHSIVADDICDDGSPVTCDGREYEDMQALMAALCEEVEGSKELTSYFSVGARSSDELDDLIVFNTRVLRDYSYDTYSGSYGYAPRKLIVVSALHVSPREVVREALNEMYARSFMGVALLTAAVLLIVCFGLVAPLSAASRSIEKGWMSVSRGRKRPRGWKEPYVILEKLEMEREELSKKEAGE